MFYTISSQYLFIGWTDNKYIVDTLEPTLYDNNQYTFCEYETVAELKLALNRQYNAQYHPYYKLKVREAYGGNFIIASDNNIDELLYATDSVENAVWLAAIAISRLYRISSVLEDDSFIKIIKYIQLKYINPLLFNLQEVGTVNFNSIGKVPFLSYCVLAKLGYIGLID